MSWHQRLVEYPSFHNHISFNICNKEKDGKSCAHQLDNMVLEFSSSSSTTIIVSNTSIKNNVAIFILYMHINNKPLTKTIYHAVYVTSTEAELFAVRCGINQATNFDNVSKIIVVTNSIHIARKIFKLSVYLYQVQSIAILSDLCNFFKYYETNSIKFWEYSSYFK